MGGNVDGALGDGTTTTTNRPELIVAGQTSFNQIFGQLLGGTNMQLSFAGYAGAYYALDWSASLSPPNWVAQSTNQAGAGGTLVLTNTPDPTLNNFWRIRSVP